MRKNLVSAVTCVMLAAVFSAAQTRIDGVLLKFGSDVITDSDVRQARLLKLVDAAGEGDQAFIDALANRRLTLLEVKRGPVVEPLEAALDAKYQQWTARLGAGADVPALLTRAGMSEAGLRGWLRDDLRIETYLDQRFSSKSNRSRDVAAWIAELRQRAGLKEP